MWLQIWVFQALINSLLAKNVEPESIINENLTDLYLLQINDSCPITVHSFVRGKATILASQLSMVSISINQSSLLKLRIRPTNGPSQRKQEIFDDNPLEIGFLSSTSSTSLSIPVHIGDFKYYDVRTILCPNVSPGKGHNTAAKVDMFFRSRITDREISVDVHEKIETIGEYTLKFPDRYKLEFSPVEPIVYYLDLSEGVVYNLMVQSLDTMCASILVHTAECPLIIWSSDGRPDYELTYTRKATLLLKKELFGEKIFVMFTLHPDDKKCGNASISVNRNKANKHSEIWLRVEKESVAVPILGYLGSVCAVLALAVACLVTRHRMKSAEPGSLVVEGKDELPAGAEALTHSQEFPEVIIPSYPSESREDLIHLDSGATEADESVSVSGVFSSRQSIPESDDMHNVPLSVSTTVKTSCILTELGQKGPMGANLSELTLVGDPTKDFPWYQLVAVLFVLLIVPLLQNSQITRVIRTGDGDVCYHNFDCAHSVWILPSLSSVFTNVVYVILGVAFIIIVKIEVYLESGSSLESGGRGPIRHFGLHYAMGITLVSIGVCSGFYHLCPNRSSIEFDMVFIHVLLGLCLLKLFAARHGSSEPHVVYVIIAAILAVTALVSIMEHNVAIWIVFVILHFMVMPYLSMQVYYNGHIEFSLTAGRAAVYSLKNLVVLEAMHGHWRPLFAHRLIILLLGNIINFVISIVIAFETGLNIQSYLFGFMLINLISYLAYYLFCKFQTGEELGKASLFFLVGAVVFWSAAVYFYSKPSMDWTKSPSESRVLNRACTIGGFFDYHDIWHFMSGSALFFSLLTIVTLDDTVKTVPRRNIMVF